MLLENKYGKLEHYTKWPASLVVGMYNMFDTTESLKERHSPLQHISFILEMKLKALITFSDIAVSTMAFII